MDDSLKAQIAAGRKLGASDEVEPIASPGDPLGSAGDEDEAPSFRPAAICAFRLSSM